MAAEVANDALAVEETRSSSPEKHAAEPHRGLMSPGFLGLLGTQLFTAINDNIFRWLAIGIGKDYVSRAEQGKILMAGTACFVLPYLVLAAPAGYLADRFKKRNVIICCKVAEVVLMALGVAAIMAGSLNALFAILALLGAQSALFSPSRSGCIPEVLPANKISAANGLFGLITVVSIVVGTVVGSYLSDATGFRGQEKIWLSATVLLAVAALGVATSLMVGATQPGSPDRRFPWNFASAALKDVIDLARQRNLLRVALGMVFFWAIGSLAQLNIDQFAFESGATREISKTPLLACLVLGLGLGSVLAGIWSQGRVELGILPLGAFGVACTSLLLFLVPHEIFRPAPASMWTSALFIACGLLLLLGISAGLFSVPLDAYLQHRSPPARRGSILAAANFLIFAGVLGSSVLFYGLRMPVLEGPAQLPARLVKTNSPQNAQQLDALAASYRQAWQSHPADEPQLDQFLERAPQSERTAALAQLLWIDVRARLEHGRPLMDLDYLEQYPDEEPVVREVLMLANRQPLLTARQIFLVCGLATIPVLLYVVLLLPQASVRFLVWLASNTIYRIRLYDRQYVPDDSGAVLAPNHISWVDGILLLVTSSRPVRFLVWSGNFQSPLMAWLARLGDAIMISSKPKAVARALREAREALKRGELVCVFPEGSISRTGQIQGFKPGVMKILEGTDAPVVPVYLDGLWGSIFSFHRGKFFWKMPRRIPYPVSIYFGRPIQKPKDVHEIRRAVQDLGANAVSQRTSPPVPPPTMLLRQCKRRLRQSKIADSTKADLTGGQLLLRALILRRLLRRRVLAADEQYVGVLLPPSVPGVLVNAALALDKRVACNLNYTVTSDVINACIELAGIRTVLTSRKFMERMNFKLNANIVYLEDFKSWPTMADKVLSAAAAYAVPAGVLNRWLGLHKTRPDDVLTIIFTSGSTGTPKGVMLTHGNVASNAEAVQQVVHLRDDDVLIGVLPFFHSFGYTISMWTVLSVNIKGAYHYSPLDAKQIGNLTAAHRGTILLATPTFLRNYARRINKEDFATIDVVVAGAERLPRDVSDAFEERFGVRPVEGYGTTELSPLVSVNIPKSRSAKGYQDDCREGSVGRPIPGVSARITKVDGTEELPVNQEGMLWIRGPNVMKGYFKRDDLTAEVLQDGWYKTGDIARIDEDGFIHITGRESRFSKIGGEMVPHIQIEESLNRLLDARDEMKAVVTAVTDPKRGERLIVLHTVIDKTPDELRKGLSEAGLPNIFIPGSDSFFQVESLPVLGSGKLDLKGIKQMAAEQAGVESQG